MKRTKLNYRFYNPNSADATADFLLRLLIEANAGKVEHAIEEAASCAEKKYRLYQTEYDNTDRKAEYYEHCSILPGINR